MMEKPYKLDAVAIWLRLLPRPTIDKQNRGAEGVLSRIMHSVLLWRNGSVPGATAAAQVVVLPVSRRRGWYGQGKNSGILFQVGRVVRISDYVLEIFARQH